MENDVLYNRIMNVVHEEYGEGSTAVANPEGEPTDDLTSIQIGDEIYGISGGGGDSPIVFVEFDMVTGALDKTFNELSSLMSNNKVVCLIMPDPEVPTITTLNIMEEIGTFENDGVTTYDVTFSGTFEMAPMYYYFTAADGNSYPVINNN